MSEILQGDWIERLRELPEASAQCCVTSPPYWGLRDYGVNGQLGLEKTPEEYVAKLVAGFAEVWRVLRDDGTIWLNLGDCYSAHAGQRKTTDQRGPKQCTNRGSSDCGSRDVPGLKAKDLVGIPWMVAFALRSNGWFLRSEITWCKKAPMPESVTDRPTCATEKIFLFSKSKHYYYDTEAVRNPPSEAMLKQVSDGYNGNAMKLFEENHVQNASSVKSRIIANARKRIDKQRGHSRRHAGFNDRWDHLSKAEQMACGSNMRNYWLLGPDPCLESHFATFPKEIPRRCVMAGSKPGDTILDPFLGSGTTGQVALELGRKFIGIDLNPDYVVIAKQRTSVVQRTLIV